MSLDEDRIARLAIKGTIVQEKLSIPGDDALPFLEQVKKDAEKIRPRGGIVGIPNN